MSAVQHFERNFSAGRDFMVGDIHGYFSKLASELETFGLDTRRDRPFSVGDLIDRGPESAQALNWLAAPGIHPVIANHVQAAIDWAEGTMHADTYHKSFGGH